MVKLLEDLYKVTKIKVFSASVSFSLQLGLLIHNYQIVQFTLVSIINHGYTRMIILYQITFKS